MKQGKGRGVVIMDKSKYTEKVLTILSTKMFQELKLDPAKSTEEKSSTHGKKNLIENYSSYKSIKDRILVVPVQESFRVQ